MPNYVIVIFTSPLPLVHDYQPEKWESALKMAQSLSGYYQCRTTVHHLSGGVPVAAFVRGIAAKEMVAV